MNMNESLFWMPETDSIVNQPYLHLKIKNINDSLQEEHCRHRNREMYQLESPRKPGRDSIKNLICARRTHSSVLAWRIPGTGEPVGLPSMGSHRVGHDWSNLAAAEVTYACLYTPSSSYIHFNIHLIFLFLRLPSLPPFLLFLLSNLPAIIIYHLSPHEFTVITIIPIQGTGLILILPFIFTTSFSDIVITGSHYTIF